MSSWEGLEDYVGESERKALEAVHRRIYAAIASARRNYGMMILNTANRQTPINSVKLLIFNDVSFMENLILSIASKLHSQYKRLMKEGAKMSPEDHAKAVGEIKELLIVLMSLPVVYNRILKETDALIAINLPFQCKSDLVRNIRYQEQDVSRESGSSSYTL